ncbi:hypothetical protein DFH09DRAFT_1503943, partial [Mycena vulgaris]
MSLLDIHPDSLNDIHTRTDAFEFSDVLGYLDLLKHSSSINDRKFLASLAEGFGLETKIVLHKNIESVLQRGERLDTLVDRSNHLSAQSTTFLSQYKTAKKTNSCCVVM